MSLLPKQASRLAPDRACSDDNIVTHRNLFALANEAQV